MTRIRKKYSAEFKHKVALAAIKGERTMADLSQHFGVHISQIQKWKSHLEKEGASLFLEKHFSRSTSEEVRISKLHEKIGQLTVERDFLAKVLDR
jgi:transposase-like protein